MFESSDDYDFTPSTSSNLASLFGTSMTFQEDANTSLTYTAPKQPKPVVKDIPGTASPKVLPPGKPKEQSTVLCAKVVTLYKLQKGEYAPLGRHGLALIQSASLDSQELIIYREKTNIITRAKVNSKFHFVNQSDTFSSFYDHANQNWLVKFENLQDRTVIAREIEKLGGEVTNDQTPDVKGGSGVTQKQENITPVTCKEKDVNVAGKSEDSTEADSHDLKITQENKTQNRDDSDSADTQVKADILNRMARMGQLILPGAFLQSQTPDLSDSDTTDSKELLKPHRKPRKFPVPKERDPRNIPISDIAKETNLVTTSTDLQVAKPFLQADALVVAQSSAVSTASRSDSLERYLIESRSRDTDLKLNLCDISTKLDYLVRHASLSSTTIHPVTNASDESVLKAKVKALELRAENLLSELQVCESKYSKLMVEYETVLNENMTKMCHTNPAEDKSFINKQNETISKLQQEVGAAQLALIESNEGIVKYRQEIDSLNSSLLTECEKVADYEKVCQLNEELEKSVDELNSTQSVMKHKIDELESRLKSKEKHEQKNLDECSVRQKLFSENLKQTMSQLYENIINSFEGKSDHHTAEIEMVVAQNIKRTTFRIIKDFENTNMITSESLGSQ